MSNINSNRLQNTKIDSSKRCIQIAEIIGGGGYVHHEQSNRVYSIYGLCPTIATRYDSFMTGFKIGYEEKDTR